MRRNRVQRCARLVVVSLALCFLTAVPALASESTITSAGSGFVVTADGYILTNEHVVGDSETVSVFIDGTAYSASVVTKSAESDLALLKIAVSGLTPVALGNSLQVQLLEEVIALGYPLPQFGRDLTVSEGRITSFRTNVGGREGRDTLQHDAVITHGSSGGPLFNLKGEVVGVNFAGVEGSGMQLAIPINEAVPLLRSIPSFSPSGMGRATQTLAAQDVVATYTKSVVYIEVSATIDWQGYLPDPGVLSALSGIQDLAPADWEYWGDTLSGLRLQVLGGAAIAQSTLNWDQSVVLVALTDAQSALAALDPLLTLPPPFRLPPDCRDTEVVVFSGATTVNGYQALCDLRCFWGDCDYGRDSTPGRLIGTEDRGEIAGTMVRIGGACRSCVHCVFGPPGSS